MSYILTSFLASFLPSQITTAILPYLSANLPSIFPPAPRGSPRYLHNYRLAFTGAICIWQAYSFLKGGLGNDDDWYRLLNVQVNADEDALKSAFRSLARKHHPDRAGNDNDDHFILARKAYETLSDPVKRYAYDRFGPKILQWKAASVREYILFGLQNSIGFYIVSGGIMLILALLGKGRSGSYWIHTLFAFLFIFELSLILSPSIHAPPILARLFIPSFLLQKPQFIQISLLHRLFASLSVSVPQLLSVWNADEDEGSKARKEDDGWRVVVGLLKNLNEEAVNEFHAEVMPLLSTGDQNATMTLIKNAMENVMVDRALVSHPRIHETYRVARMRASHRTPSKTPLSFSAKRAPSSISSQNPSRELSAASGYTPSSSVTDVLAEQLLMAVDIPLPPSPPLTPRSGPQRLE
ncbi:chaperone protein DNAJ [Cryptococcus neoformans C23]|uniref:Chaperone protein DNAJ n=2 Tax=Cryptococcus neoformans TaxID=5207 RepID=A0A854QH07_CRYNE|nr:chaperone protein DNAJ [Cryptococcus neoformans var. grubii H99]AFR93945.2 chaperone protein DNAJ [Cryptococcus neoformans var. grubii H99]AUB23540.1 chaperone protein DNAJ [Cryptococcus neoformans var. grubii]OWZ46604.1 chaperone protein DNAJ [Cryptococcus neoformans var. grubii C23]OXG25764.1 chaperone protein DNAJ [Cryptococcus neoformans var. grubii Tu259-1]|eukprot:XP_012047912.1 chaperone protein DNAJ [Cryptococcus neoformans var. grubii H99]